MSIAKPRLSSQSNLKTNQETPMPQAATQTVIEKFTKMFRGNSPERLKVVENLSMFKADDAANADLADLIEEIYDKVNFDMSGRNPPSRIFAETDNFKSANSVISLIDCVACKHLLDLMRQLNMMVDGKALELDSPFIIQIKNEIPTWKVYVLIHGESYIIKYDGKTFTIEENLKGFRKPTKSDPSTSLSIALLNFTAKKHWPQIPLDRNSEEDYLIPVTSKANIASTLTKVSVGLIGKTINIAVADPDNLNLDYDRELSKDEKFLEFLMLCNSLNASFIIQYSQRAVFQPVVYVAKSTMNLTPFMEELKELLPNSHSMDIRRIRSKDGIYSTIAYVNFGYGNRTPNLRLCLTELNGEITKVEWNIVPSTVKPIVEGNNDKPTIETPVIYSTLQELLASDTSYYYSIQPNNPKPTIKETSNHQHSSQSTTDNSRQSLLAMIDPQQAIINHQTKILSNMLEELKKL